MPADSLFKMAFARALHALLVLSAVPFWIVGVLMFGVALLWVLAADRVWPNATWGNCWSFVGPKWAKFGGYMGVRLAPDVRIFGVRVIPHAFWIPAWPADTPVQQTMPRKRSKNPLHTPYFPFSVATREKPIDSTWSDL
jgi:hypothetical protein